MKGFWFSGGHHSLDRDEDGELQVAHADANVMRDKVKDEKANMFLAMTRNDFIRMKPRRLFAGLPFRDLEAAT